MKAMMFDKFGSPDVLTLREIAKPEPRENEILIRVRATTVEREDPMMRAAPGLNGLFAPARKILGLYMAGDVEECGSKVTRFAPGDRVYGCTGMRVMGGNAEYVCAPQTAGLVKIPTGVNYADAVALVNGMLTAVPFLREQVQLTPGQEVLINGASGSVGTAGVQVAAALGARVTGVCGARNATLVRSLGAEEVIDYTAQDFTRCGLPFDVVFDAMGNSSFARCEGLLRPGGSYLTTSPTLDMLRPSRAQGKRVRFAATGLRAEAKKQADLEFVNGLIGAGQARAVIDRSYPLEDLPAAHRYVEGGHKVGCVVITVSQ